MIIINRILIGLVLMAFSWMLAAHFVTTVHDINQKKNVLTRVIQSEKPLHSVKLPNFAHITNVSEKKRLFFNFLTPLIHEENRNLKVLHEEILVLKRKSIEKLTTKNISFIKKLVNKYKVDKQLSLSKQLNKLMVRVDQVPEELVLVQAAIESGWGTSRFARIGLNFFGIWCYQPHCGMIPIDRNLNAVHEVAVFKSVKDGVDYYFYNINTNAAYKKFRHIRAQLRAENLPLSPEVLASGLLSYSSRGENYVMEIIKMLKQNQAYFVEPKTIRTD